MKHKKDVLYRLTFSRSMQTEYYRQLKSIYAYHTRSDVGCGVEHLYWSKIDDEKPFENKQVRIEVVEVR